MKLTGTIILCIGLVMGLFTAVQYLTAPVTPTPPTNGIPLPMLQFLFAGVAVATGALLLVYGGSGIIRTRNPAIRN